MTPTVRVDEFRLSYVFDVVNPIPEDRLSEMLSTRGFTVLKQRYFVVGPIRAVLFNIATLRNTAILLEQENPPTFVGASGRDRKQVANTFDILRGILAEIDPSLLRESSAVEMVITTKVLGDKLPQNTIPKLASDKFPNLEPIFGSKLGLFSANFYSHHQPDKPDWFIRIEPLITSPRYYFVQLTYRDRDLSNVLKVADKSEEIIKESISKIEEI